MDLPEILFGGLLAATIETGACEYIFLQLFGCQDALEELEGFFLKRVRALFSFLAASITSRACRWRINTVAVNDRIGETSCN